jgi:uncharacterized protein (TIGR04222 family)
MTHDGNWSQSERELWQRLDAHDFGTADCPLPFARRLAREHGWSQAHADGAVREYKRFCFLAVAAGHVVTPSDAVDEVWHQHLTYSRDYWQHFCPDVLGSALHHEPTRGGPAQNRLHYAQYAETLASYQRWFGPPPEAYWPDARTQTASPARWRRVDLARGWLLPRPALPRPGWAQWLAAVVLLGMAPLLQALPLNPLDYSGPAFLLLYFVLIAAAIGGGVLVRRQLRGHADAVPHGATLDTWSVAYLAGGTLRVVDAGTASLLANGQAQWDARKRRLDVARPQDVRDYPLDEIARAAAADPSLPRIVRRVKPRLQRLRDLLRSRGLLLTESRRWSVGLASALPFALLAGFGLAKISVGIDRGRPVGFLMLLTALVAITALVLLLRRPERTRAGDALLAELNRRHAHARRAPRDSDIGLAVALAGTTVLAGTAYASFHESRAASGNSSSGCSSGSSCSSDGGGSSCSSGCGGCGGGGD